MGQWLFCHLHPELANNTKKKSLKKNGDSFKKRIFSKEEIIYCDTKKNPFAFYAKRFAAKEALSKALGTGIRKGIDFKNIEISNDSFGKPSIKLKGSTANFLKNKIKTNSFWKNIYHAWINLCSFALFISIFSSH